MLKKIWQKCLVQRKISKKFIIVFQLHKIISFFSFWGLCAVWPALYFHLSSRSLRFFDAILADIFKKTKMTCVQIFEDISFSKFQKYLYLSVVSELGRGGEVLHTNFEKNFWLESTQFKKGSCQNFAGWSNIFVSSPVLTILSQISIHMSTAIWQSFVKIGLKTKMLYQYAKFWLDPFLNFVDSSKAGVR